jgi:hypothetical protein
MKTTSTSLKLISLLLILILPAFAFGQGQQSTNLSGTYILASGQTTLKLVLNQSGNSLSGSLTSTTGAGYQLQGQVMEGVGTGKCNGDGTSVFFEAYASGNELTLGLIEPDQSNQPDYNKVQTLLFTRQSGQGGSQSQTGNITGQLFGDQQSNRQDNNMQNNQSGNNQQNYNQQNYNQGQQGSNLIGTWIFQNQQGQLVLEFKSASQLTFNGEATQYQLRQGVIQAMGDYGWIDYPYTLNQGVLTITFPDGTQIPFTKSSSTAMNQQGANQQGGGGSAWQLRGALCSYSGSSNDYSSYSRTQKIVFDGQGNFQVGSEASFSSGDGIAYGGNPNVSTGTYAVGENTVTLYYQDGSVYEFKINMRQNNGMITELMYSGTLYATGLCE